MFKGGKNSEKGAGLIEVLIASGVLLVVINILMQSFLNFKKFQKYENMQLSTLFLKNYINEKVDCDATVEEIKGSCKQGSAIELVSKKGKVLIEKAKKDSDYTKIGNYQVRAVCGPDSAIDIESRLVNSKNQPVPHPLKTNLKANELWVSMYKNVKFQCELDD